jgi:hypothetical protein
VIEGCTLEEGIEKRQPMEHTWYMVRHRYYQKNMLLSSLFLLNGGVFRLIQDASLTIVLFPSTPLSSHGMSIETLLPNGVQEREDSRSSSEALTANRQKRRVNMRRAAYAYLRRLHHRN